MTGLSVFLSILCVGLLVALALLIWRLQSGRIATVRAESLGESTQQELEVARSKITELQQTIASQQQALGDAREEASNLRVRLDLERGQAQERQEFLTQSKEQLGAAFKNLANDILESKSAKFTETSKDSLGAVLGPLKERLQQFEKRVEESYNNEARERFSLAKEIANLRDLNTRIGKDAENLTNALKGDNKTQGNWGEFVLESILEMSGLVKGREYDVQMSLKSEDGSRSQPDVVVHLPESRDIIIDSKVSLKAWDDYCGSDDPEAKLAALKLHVQSLRQHVKGLSEKDYQNLIGVNSLDYVFLFMPIEAAYAEALRQDRDLFQYAFERNVIFVVPSTLLTSLRTVQNLWRLVQQNRNAAEIAKRAGLLYDKFVSFVEDLNDVGKKIDASRKSFDKAHGKLASGHGNLQRQAEMLRKLGARTSKQLDRSRFDDDEDLSGEQDALLEEDSGSDDDDQRN